MTFVGKHTKLEANAVYGGVPAKRIS
jgi:hypothetical protein